MYVLCLHGAGDYLMATSAITAICDQFKDVFFVYARDEVRSLAACNVQHRFAGSVAIGDLASMVSRKNPTLFISLCGPSLKISRLLLLRKWIFFIGFLDSFVVKTNFLSPKSEAIDYLFYHHIRRNNRVVESYAKCSVKVDIVFRSQQEPPVVRTKILLYFPTEKAIKSWPDVRVEQLRSAIAAETCLDGSVELLRFNRSPEIENRDLSYRDFSTWHELIEALNEAALIITLDSVVFHLAQAHSIPVVGIFGATNPRNYSFPKESTITLVNRRNRYCYYGHGFRRCQNATERCTSICNNMLNVTVEDALEAAVALIGNAEEML